MEPGKVNSSQGRNETDQGLFISSPGFREVNIPSGRKKIPVAGLFSPGLLHRDVNSIRHTSRAQNKPCINYTGFRSTLKSNSTG